MLLANPFCSGPVILLAIIIICSVAVFSVVMSGRDG